MCQVIIKSSGKTHPWASEIQTLFTSVQRTESHSGSWVFVLVWFFVRPALHFAQLLLFCDLHSNSALLCNVLCAIFSALWIKKKKKKRMFMEILIQFDIYLYGNKVQLLALEFWAGCHCFSLCCQGSVLLQSSTRTSQKERKSEQAVVTESAGSLAKQIFSDKDEQAWYTWSKRIIGK